VFLLTIKDVAKIAGVSTATVSYVINNSKNVTEEKRRRVLEAIEQSGYRPNHVAKSLRVKKTNTIGVLVEDIMGYPVPALINGVSEYAEKNEYQIFLND
jgi:LacI family transcriptional regulator